MYENIEVLRYDSDLGYVSSCHIRRKVVDFKHLRKKIFKNGLSQHINILQSINLTLWQKQRTIYKARFKFRIHPELGPTR